MNELVVVGAGPAGLTAAWRAALVGHDVRVIDGAAAVGGMAASFEVAGQRVDLGSHRLHPSAAPHVLAALRSLLGDDLQTRTRHGRLRLQGSWIGFPLRGSELIRRLPPRFAARATFDAVTKPLRRPEQDTFADVVRVGLGPAMLREFYGPYARKLWGADASSLAGELARRRIAAGSPTAMLRKVVRGARPGARTFLYPRLGYGQIVEALAAAAVDAGARIDLGAPVERVEARDAGVTLHLGGGAVVDAARVLWTAPLGRLVTAVPDAPAPVVTAATQLAHRAMTLVYLVVDRPQYTPYDAHYVPDASVSLTRLSEPKNYRDGPDPEATTVLCAEVPCTIGDEWWTASAGAAADRVAGELEAIGLDRPRVIGAEIRRLPSVYPVLRTDSLASLATVSSWAASRPRVTVLGRQGLFVADNLHHVMDMGWAAAAALRPHGAIDERVWADARQRFATFVVED
jgi:protoporphyrinogen oxidase